MKQFQGKDKGLIQYPVTKADMGTQTEVHPIETNLVKTYEWNEWELRRKAIKLVSNFSFQFFFSIFKNHDTIYIKITFQHG